MGEEKNDMIMTLSSKSVPKKAREQKTENK